jgi:cation/acetate symporter
VLASLDAERFFVLLLLIFAVVVLGLLVLNWLFPLIETGTADDVSQRPTNRIRALPLAIPARRPTTPHSPSPSLAPAERRRYWRANLWLIAPLLLVWCGASIGPALGSTTLNRWRIGGFPLGYYLGAQTALLLFVLLIAVYGWAAERLDRRYTGAAEQPLRAHPGARRSVLALACGFALLLLLLEQLETRWNLPARPLGWALLLITLAAYALIGLRSRSHTLAEYYVAGRDVGPLLNGMAIGADWMSAATFVALAGTLWRLGYEGLAYIMGWTGGYVLLALLIAPYLRRWGEYTVPDFIGARYGQAARVLAAILGILISFTYLTAQVTGVGLIISQFLGVGYAVGVLIGLSAVLFCSFVGGMQAITWTQVAQCVVMLIAYLVPVTWLAYQVTGVPLPQFVYGEALQEIATRETALGIGSTYITPFNDWSRANFVALTLCLMMGTAGLPHLLIRSLTTPSVQATRRSISWGIVFIVLLYSAIPAYAAFARREVLIDVIGQRLDDLPAWTERWTRNGQFVVDDRNNDGVVQQSELTIAEDVIVLATPEMAGLPNTITALVGIGGLAAALSTADGLLLVIASAAAHDLYFKTFSPRANARKRLLVGRIMLLTAALLAALTAIRQLGIIVQLVAWAFSLAAATIFPVLVLGIFWRRANGKGAVAGMICGLIVTLAYMIGTLINPDLAVLGISNVAAGIFGVPVNIGVTWLISSLTTAPNAQVRNVIDVVRSP